MGWNKYGGPVGRPPGACPRHDTRWQIATSPFIGESTVKTHINDAFAKIGARSRSDATRYVYRQEVAEG
ncbi:LuxR C-terminal-related transcriptional regulator [Streptosporangium sp. NPDC003464]